jgi:peptidoglycan/LPS O-acetylase OafA/YrhL
MEHEFHTNDLSNFSAINLFKNLLGIQTWVGSPSLNNPSWSVSAEFFVYLIFPLVVFLFLKSEKHILLKAPVMWFLSFGFFVFTPFQSSLVNPQLLQAITEFFMGLATYMLVRTLKPSAKLVRNIRAANWVGELGC